MNCLLVLYPIGLGRSNVIYYDISILQNNKELNLNLWKPVKEKKNLTVEQSLFVVNKRFFIPQKPDDAKKDFIRLDMCWF